MAEFNDEKNVHITLLKETMNKGEIVTHVLNWKVFKQSNSIIDSIRKIMYKLIVNVSHTSTILGATGVKMQWYWPAGHPTTYYYYTNSMYSDRITKEHIKIMMLNVVKKIKQDAEYAELRNHSDYQSEWGISYLVTKPLEYSNGEIPAGYVM